jgi:hypothetical protein
MGDFPAVMVPALVKSGVIADIASMSKAPTGRLSLKALVEDARGVGISADEVREIHKVVKSHRPPADVRAVEVNFGKDWIGAPAAWISSGGGRPRPLEGEDHQVEQVHDCSPERAPQDKSELFSLRRCSCNALIREREPPPRSHRTV